MARIPLFAAGLVAALALAPGCDREADPLLCGEIGAGELVVTEIRGGPGITDADGQWIELYNAAGGAVDLHGVSIIIQSIGGNTDRVMIRRPAMVGAGSYAVVGKFADGARPAHVDVGWGTEPVIPRDGAITLGCAATEIDRLVFTSLPDPSQTNDNPPSPGHGTYAYGVLPPTAAGNDDASKWCTDATTTPPGPCTGATCVKSYEGSPGEPNPGCTP